MKFYLAYYELIESTLLQHMKKLYMHINDNKDLVLHHFKHNVFISTLPFQLNVR